MASPTSYHEHMVDISKLAKMTNALAMVDMLDIW